MNWISLILSGVITSIGVYYALKNLSQQKFSRKGVLIFIICSTIILSLNGLINGVAKPLFSVLSTIFISYYMLFEKNLNKSIYYSFIEFLLNVIIEVIFTLVLVTLFKYSTDDYNNLEYSLFIFSTVNSVVLYFVTKIKILIKLCNKYESKIVNNKIIKIYILIICIMLTLLSINNFLNYEKNIEYYVNFGMLIFVIIVSMFIFYNKMTKDKIEKSYREMMEYVSKYEQIINEQGKKNHEFNNQLMVLNGYIGNEEKLREYLGSIIDDHKGGKNYTIEQLSYFPDGGIKGLIYHKLSRMEEYEIRPYLYISNEVKDIFETKFDVNTYSDITKLFGVFLDNAIEAAKDAEKKEIEIDMKKDGEYLIVTIGNTYSKDVDVEKIGKKGFTTKGVGHGFGLSLVKDIIKKNSKIESFNDVTNDMFKQTIMIDLN